MKKAMLSVLLVLSLLLTGCGKVSVAGQPETLRGWYFQYNEGTNDYSLLFGLLDEHDRAMSADVDVDIRIENKNGEKVYAATKSVSTRNFGTFTSKARGEEYLAEIRIPEKDIVAGTTGDGIIYLTVYKGNTLLFDEVHCDAFACLPIQDLKLEAAGLPAEIPVKGYDGRIESKIQIENVSYVFEKEISPVLKITVTGTKTYGDASSLYDCISYKVCDEEGYVVDTGTIYLDELSNGDKFKNDSIVIYDIEPGKKYTITFSESNI